MSLKSIEFFSKYIEKETGIIFMESNLYQLKTRLEEIVAQEKLASIDDLAAKFQGFGLSLSLKQKLLDHSTNNETLFFRDPGFFTALESFVQTEIAKQFPSEIKIWSAAASTGQEALSVAMVLDELSKRIPLPPVSILATDISEKAINKARAGLYSDFEIRRGLSEERKNNYFTKVGENWQAKPSIHSKIKFGINNLIQSTVMDQFHLILCRNVLIYQKIEMKKVVVESLSSQLAKSGALMLGVGETMLGISDGFETKVVGNVVLYKKGSSSLKKAV